MNDVDRQIEATRRGLASLEAAGVIACDGVGGGQMLMVMDTIPAVKGIVLFDKAGERLCSVGPASERDTRRPGTSGEATQSADRLDLVQLDATGGNALRVSHRGLPTGYGYVALIPVEGLAQPDRTPGWFPIGRRSLMVGTVDALLPAGAPQSVTDADAAVEPLAMGPVPDRAAALSAQAELSDVDLSIDVAASAGDVLAVFWRERTVVDCAVALIGLSLLLLLVRWRRKLDPLQFAVRTAFAQREFALVYNPVVDLATAQLEGVEADLCWRRAGRLTAAEDFMPAIIAGGWSHTLLQIAIRRVQADLASAFRLRGTLRLRLRLFDPALITPDLVEVFKSRFGGRDIRLPQLMLRLDRAGFASAHAATVLRQLQALGITLAGEQGAGADRGVDQCAAFGFGLIELDRIHVDALDVESCGDAEMLALAERRILASVNLARNYGIKVSASGVRTHAQIRRLKQLGVDHASGPVFAEGLSGGSFLALVARTGLRRDEPVRTQNVA